MTKTLATNAGPFMSAAQAVRRLDVRFVGDMVSDDNTRVAAADLPTNANLAACLADASGQVERAAYRGKRYAASDLAVLAAADGTPAQGALFRVLTRVLVCCLFERRPDREMRMPEVAKQAAEDLRDLADGVEIFPFLEAQSAGLPAARTERTQEVEARGGITFAMARYFGRRLNRRGP